MARRTGMLGLLATLIAALLVLWAPLAIAQPSSPPDREETSDHDGDADSDPDTTEDESEADESTADEDDNAHPSGKDRSVENSTESNPNQGKSESNPDDSVGPQRCEGVCGEDDKANAGGGEDAADQDGNNGCGNDDDFDDDNNGWCGKPTDTDTDVEGDETEDDVEGDVIVDKPCDADASMPGTQPCEKPPLQGAQPLPYPEVEGEQDDETPSTLPGVISNPADVEDSVLGERITRGGSDVAAAAVAPAAAAPAAEVEGAALPFTGGSIVQILVTGLSLVALGGVSILARK